MRSKIVYFLFQIVIRTSTSDMVYKGKESNAKKGSHGIPVQIGESRRPKTKTKGQMHFQKEDRNSSQESRQGSLQILTSSSALSNPTPTSSLALWQITCYSLLYLRWSILHPLSSLPSSLLCPAGTAYDSAYPQASPAREAYRLTTDIHLALSSSKTNAPVLSPALQETTHCSLPPWPSFLLQWITQIHSFKLLSPNSLLYLSPQLQQAFPGSLQITGSCEAERPATDLPLCFIPLSPIPKSHFQIWSRPPAEASPHSLPYYQGTKQTWWSIPLSSLLCPFATTSNSSPFLRVAPNT